MSPRYFIFHLRVFRYALLAAVLSFFAGAAMAQLSGTPQVPGTPLLPGNSPQRDTTKRAPSGAWTDQNPITFSVAPFSQDTVWLPDTSIRFLHRRPYSQPWKRDLGNFGTPQTSLMFSPVAKGEIGPRLGYTVMDGYRIDPDSISSYSTTRPYSLFSYNLGSKLEQLATIFHTQNIRPSWNFAFEYRKLTSPGFYRIQRANQDHGGLSTSYTSRGQHYRLFAALVYNREQQDENGGLLADSLLGDSRYADRRTLPVAFQNDFYSTQRSSVTNDFRNVQLLLEHQYTFGKRDTTWSADSTAFTYRLIPRFSLRHRLSMGTDRLVFRNMQADSVLWSGFFTSGLSRTRTDSIAFTQRQQWVENVFGLEGSIGNPAHPLRAFAGLGIRVDQFATTFPTGQDESQSLNNFLTGSLEWNSRRWTFSAATKFFFSGPFAGDFFVEGLGSRRFGKDWAVSLRLRQDLRDVAYNMRIYEHRFYDQRSNLPKESFTLGEAIIHSGKLDLYLGVRLYLIHHMAYLASPDGQVTQGALDFKSSGTLTYGSAWLRKDFKWRALHLYNELVYQKKDADGVISVPTFMGRHQLSAEVPLFQDALRIAVGAQVLYYTPYTSNGYAPFYARFYDQDAEELRNGPELSAFFNFRVKRFRAYLAADQLQELLGVGNFAVPRYPDRGFNIRFGFSWVMIN